MRSSKIFSTSQLANWMRESNLPVTVVVVEVDVAVVVEAVVWVVVIAVVFVDAIFHE